MTSRFQLTTEIIFGDGSIDNLSTEAAKLGRKALLVTYPDIRRVGLLDRVVNDLKAHNIEVAIFDKVQCNPRTTTVDEGAAFARQEKPDFFIGLGGGSVMDTTKGIAITSTGTASVWDYVLHRAAPQSPISPHYPGAHDCRHRFRNKSQRRPHSLGIPHQNVAGRVPRASGQSCHHRPGINFDRPHETGQRRRCRYFIPPYRVLSHR